MLAASRNEVLSGENVAPRFRRGIRQPNFHVAPEAIRIVAHLCCFNPCKPARCHKESPFALVAPEYCQNVFGARTGGFEFQEIAVREEVGCLAPKIQRLPNRVKFNLAVLPMVRELSSK